MGSGSDVAKNAADIILLDDNFSSIVNGVAEGRRMFDNLKKSICYTLGANPPELFPVLCQIIIQVPVPLTAILMVLICLGTDLYPAISLAYENAELDIMQRAPRNTKHDSLVTKKLIAYAYPIWGIVQSLGGMFTYFYVMNDYGFKPHSLLFMILEYGYYPLASDVYNPYEPNFGNSNFANSSYQVQLAWSYVLE
jgi:sodium/potassium-transporting ATPase subunit alpha